MQYGKRNPKGKLNFPGFQEILDFTATGSESSVSVAVDGDTDKEYIISGRNPTNTYLCLRLNSDTGSNYGRQYLLNSSGTISAARSAESLISFTDGNSAQQLCAISLLTPAGLIKTAFTQSDGYASGTTLDRIYRIGWSWNSTANVISLTVFPHTGNFTAGTRITVLARRSQS